MLFINQLHRQVKNSKCSPQVPKRGPISAAATRQGSAEAVGGAWGGARSVWIGGLGYCPESSASILGGLEVFIVQLFLSLIELTELLGLPFADLLSLNVMSRESLHQKSNV